MRVLILGVGDAFSSRSFGSSALIEGPERHVLIDCPAMVQRALREATEHAGWSADVTTIDDIILTHLHGDHCNGLESVGFQRVLRRAAGEAAPRIHCARPVADRLWERLAPAMDAPMGGAAPSVLEDYFDVRLLDAGRSVDVAGLSVECRLTTHPIPTFGLLIGDGSATLGWSGDTPFEPAHVEWLSRADVIVHESNCGAAHTPIEDLNALPESIRARMRLIHLPDDFEASRTDITILRQGDVIDL